MAIEWRAVPGYPDYEISEYGKVRRICPLPAHLAGRNMSPFIDCDGYLCMNIRRNGKRKKFFIHRLVAMTFISDAPSPDHEAAHNDGSKQNNHFSNLRWATRTENENDKFKHGTHNRGERHGRARLSDSQVKAIIARLKTNEVSRKDLANEYGVEKTSISDIAQGRSWKHLSLEQ